MEIKLNPIRFLSLILVWVGFSPAAIFVSPNGSDGADGSKSNPFATWSKAQSVISAGDTVYFRAGVYIYTKSTSSCKGQKSKVSAIVLKKSGSPGKRIHYFNYPGEQPVFDFYGMKDNCRIRAIEVQASWIHVKGLEIMGLPQNNNKNHENWGILATGSNNIYELLNIHHIMGAGLFILDGEGNLVLNCDSHSNFDKYTSNGAGESADGFGVHAKTPGTRGNTLRGCRAWWNADDGFDCIHCNSPVMVENCWNFLNGYIPGTREKSGNGNGFKMGGFDIPPRGVPSKIPSHTVRNCLAFFNKAAGFYQNHHFVPNIYHNNTAYQNLWNFNLLGYDKKSKKDANMGILRNNIAFVGTDVRYGTGSGVDSKNNTWDLSITVSESDFLSLDTTGIFGPRKPDGSLPELKFLRLSGNSRLIDRGIDIQLPFNGSNPDLGAFEYSPETKVGKPFLSILPLMNQDHETRIFDISGKTISPYLYHKISGSRIFIQK